MLQFLWFASIIACALAITVPSSGCGTKAPVKPGVSTTQTIKINDPISGEITRVYRLHLPSDYDENKAYYFIIDFHGYYDNAANEEKEDKLPEVLSDKYGVIFVYPYGSNDSASNLYGWDSVGTTAVNGTCNTNRRFWGEYQCYTSCKGCNPTNQCHCSSCWDDVLFTQNLMNKMESTLCIDKSNIHATGISNGGMMDYQVAISFSDIFASIVPVAGSSLLGYNAMPKYPISLQDWHGTNDHIIPSNVSNSYQYPKYIAPDGATWSSDGFYYTPTGNNTKQFAELNKCEGTNGWRHYPTAYDGQRNLYCFKPFGECQYGTDVVQCVGDWGHTWPLHAQDQTAYANLVWQFVSTHPKQTVIWKSSV